MATIKALIRSTRKDGVVNIRFRLSDGRNVQLFHSSDILIDINLWDAKKECVKTRALCKDDVRKRINDSIDERKKLLLSIYDANKNTELTSAIFEELIDKELYPQKYDLKDDGFSDLMELYFRKRKYSDVRAQYYQVLVRALQIF